MEIITQTTNPKAFTAIDELSFSMLKIKLMDKDEGEGWTYQECERIEWKYKMFLKLIYLYPKENIVPDKEIDIFWHYHILDTRDYIAVTNRIFGSYIHHYPYFGLNGEDDKKDLLSCFTKTESLFKKHFGFSLTNTNSVCSSGDDGGDSSTCASRCRY
jgi:hypothetical protein